RCSFRRLISRLKRRQSLGKFILVLPSILPSIAPASSPQVLQAIRLSEHIYCATASSYRSHLLCNSPFFTSQPQTFLVTTDPVPVQGFQRLAAYSVSNVKF